MITNLCASIAVCAMTADLPAVPLEELRAQGVELVARATPTRFVALNPSDHALMLVFRDVQSGANASHVLPAGGEVEYRFPLGTLGVLEMEVWSVNDGALVSSGTYELEPLQEPDVDAIWMVAANSRLYPFAQVSADFFDVPTQGAHASGEGGTEAVAPPHLPVISPSAHPIGDQAPVIDDALPPV